MRVPDERTWAHNWNTSANPISPNSPVKGNVDISASAPAHERASRKIPSPNLRSFQFELIGAIENHGAIFDAAWIAALAQDLGVADALVCAWGRQRANPGHDDLDGPWRYRADAQWVMSDPTRRVSESRATTAGPLGRHRARARRRRGPWPPPRSHATPPFASAGRAATVLSRGTSFYPSHGAVFAPSSNDRWVRPDARGGRASGRPGLVSSRRRARRPRRSPARPPLVRARSSCSLRAASPPNNPREASREGPRPGRPAPSPWPRSPRPRR